MSRSQNSSPPQRVSRLLAEQSPCRDSPFSMFWVRQFKKKGRKRKGAVRNLRRPLLSAPLPHSACLSRSRGRRASMLAAIAVGSPACSIGPGTASGYGPAVLRSLMLRAAISTLPLAPAGRQRWALRKLPIHSPIRQADKLAYPTGEGLEITVKSTPAAPPP